MTKPLQKKKLVMTLFVRDEADIIKQNIDFHLANGVDFILATDNNSKDGTRDILIDYQKKGFLRLFDEKSLDYPQEKCVNQMAKIAYEEYGAEIIFHCDADEFWFAKSGDLKKEFFRHLDADGFVIGTRLILLRDKDGKEFFPEDSVYEVIKPFNLTNPIVDSLEKNIYLYASSPKVAFKTRKGVQEVSISNHSIRTNDQGFKVKKIDNIKIYHFPIRNKKQFECKVIKLGTAGENNPEIMKDNETNWHVKRWREAGRSGNLDAEYKRLILDKNQASGLINQGVIRKIDPNKLFLICGKLEKQDENLKKELSFDLYGRYALIRDIINHNRRPGQVFKVLDVGGRGNLMREFLYQDKVFYLDPFVDTKDSNYIQGDGCQIPLKNESCDWVVSADVFEHVEAKKREIFVKENIRVAKAGVILAAPFHSESVKKAEKNANENFKVLTGGKNHKWLKEHLDMDLPIEKELEVFFNKNNLNFLKFNNNSLFLWQILICVNFLCFDNYLEKPIASLEKLNYFYNSVVFPLDNSENSYRKIYLIKKKEKLDFLLKKEKIDPGIYNEVFIRAFRVINQINFEKNNLIIEKNKFIELKDTKALELNNLNISLEKENNGLKLEISHLNNDIRKYRNDLVSKEKMIESQNQELNKIINSLSWKLTQPLRDLNWAMRNPIKFLKKHFIYKLPKKVQRRFMNLGKKIIFNSSFIRKHYRSGLNHSDKEYQIWLDRHYLSGYELLKQKKSQKNLKYRPKISIITPVYNVDKIWLEKCINSVLKQTYDNWELCLADDCSTKTHVKEVLNKFKNKDKRIKVIFRDKNGNISEASNSALSLATGEFIGLLDNDDELAPNALYETVKVLNTNPKIDFIYSDEDKINSLNYFVEPFFKPDWSPDYFLSAMYTCHFGVYRKKIVDLIGGFKKGYEGSQDYDFVLRFIEKIPEKNIFHIDNILYHWRKIIGSTALKSALKSDQKTHSVSNAKKALSDYLKRNNIQAEVLDGLKIDTYRIKREILDNPKVTIIIPLKDQSVITKRCVESILEKTSYENYELLLINNQSKEVETTQFLNYLTHFKRIRVVNYQKPFNYSAINNFAVSKCSSEYVLFLNNDTEVISKNWLEAFLEHIQRPEVAAVGALLLYPNDLIQHAGVIIGLGGVAGHAFSRLPIKQDIYFHFPSVIKNYSAVTAACMIFKKNLFLELGGFDEKNFPIAFNDIDLCLKAIKKGYKIIYTPYAKLYHYESLSRGYDDNIKNKKSSKYKRIMRERLYFKKKWKDMLKRDPNYNHNLSKNCCLFTFN